MSLHAFLIPQVNRNTKRSISRDSASHNQIKLFPKQGSKQLCILSIYIHVCNYSLNLVALNQHPVFNELDCACGDVTRERDDTIAPQLLLN